MTILSAACVPTESDDQTSATEASSSSSSASGSLTTEPSTSEDPTSTGLDANSSSSTTSTTDIDTDPDTWSTSEGTGTTTTGDPTESICGDGLVSGDEECDDGPENSDHAACTTLCKAAYCGDGLIQLGKESCDAEDANGDGSYGGCTDLCQKGPHCGDKVHQPEHEECDPLDPELDDGSRCEGCTWDANLLFVTSERFTGSLDGLDGADQRCEILADAAKLSNPSKYKAWISTDDKSPSTRITPPPGAFILTTGTEVAASWAEFIGGLDLDTAIAVDENKQSVAKPHRAWSNTNPDGSSLKAPDCNGWTSEMVGLIGSYGSTKAVDATWTDADTDWCSQKNRLYCIATAG